MSQDTGMTPNPHQGSGSFVCRAVVVSAVAADGPRDCR